LTIGGGSCSGKSTLANQLHLLFPSRHVFVLPLDHYYDDTAHFSKKKASITNLDVPDAIDIGMALRDIEEIYTGTIQFLPHYNFITRKRTFRPFQGPQPDILILEGLFALYYTSLNEIADLKIFVETSLETMLSRRITRDTSIRGTSKQETINRYEKFVHNSYNTLVLPTRKNAHVIVNGESSLNIQLANISSFLNRKIATI